MANQIYCLEGKEAAKLYQIQLYLCQLCLGTKYNRWGQIKIAQPTHVQPWQLFENTESDVASVVMMVNIKTSREAYQKKGEKCRPNPALCFCVSIPFGFLVQPADHV